MKAYGGVNVEIHIFLTSVPAGGEWSASRPDRLPPGEKAPGTHWIGGWVDPRAGLDYLEKRKFLTLLGLELRPLGGPARSHSLSVCGAEEKINLFCCDLNPGLLSRGRHYTHWAMLAHNVNKNNNNSNCDRISWSTIWGLRSLENSCLNQYWSLLGCDVV
jgi:hypothetical protein